MKFVPDPERALQGMYRVLRPRGRAVTGPGKRVKATAEDASGTVSAWGQWQWNDSDARRLMAGVGFVDVTASFLPVGPREQLVRGTRPAGVAGGW